MNELIDFDRVVWRESNSIDRFKMEFITSCTTEIQRYQITTVRWSSVDMKIWYIDLNRKSNESSTFCISRWMDYYNKNKDINIKD